MIFVKTFNWSTDAALQTAVNDWIADTVRKTQPYGVAGKTPRDIRIHFRTSTEVVVTVVVGIV